MLKEDLYLSNKPKFSKAEMVLDEMIKTSDEKVWKKSLRLVEKELNKIFNIRLTIELDFGEPCNIMRNVVTQDIVDEYYMETKSVVVSKKNGYRFIRTVDVHVVMEYYSIIYMMEEVSNKNLSLNGSHLLACILHEIGHSIYLPFEYKEDSYGQVWFKTEGTPNIVIYPEFFSKFRRTAEAVRYVLLYPILCMSAYKKSKTPLFVSVAKFGSKNSLVNKILERRSITDVHNKSERNADSFPFQYGYGKEIIEFAILIEKLFIFGNGKFRNSLDNFVKGQDTKKSVLNIKGMIEYELKNPNNSPEDIQFLNALKKDYRTRLKKLIRKEM